MPDAKAHSVKNYFIIVLALIMPWLLFLPIILEYAERVVGRASAPPQNLFMDILVIAFVVIFTGLNILRLVELVRYQKVSLVIPWVAIGLSVVSVIFMILLT